MPTIHKSAVVPHTPNQMYDLVNDIARYPEFIPWCVDSQVTHQEADELRATLSFAKGGLVKSFTTVNRLQPHRMIEIRLLEGPFKHLEGFWQFTDQVTDQDKKCVVSLDLEFEFATKILALMFGPLFQQVATMLVDSFVSRADIIYGGQYSETT